MYEFIFRCKWLGDGCKTLKEIADNLRDTANELEEMHDEGLSLDEPMRDDYAFIRTEHKDLAKKYGFYELELEEMEE